MKIWLVDGFRAEQAFCVSQPAIERPIHFEFATGITAGATEISNFPVRNRRGRDRREMSRVDLLTKLRKAGLPRGDFRNSIKRSAGNVPRIPAQPVSTPLLLMSKVSAGHAKKAATSSQQWHVTLSRGRCGIRIFTPDKQQLRENAARSGHRPLALELTDGLR